MISHNFQLDTDYIELVKLIKLYTKGMSGGQIKIIIEQGEIKRNGNTELRKRAKLVKGDIIVFEDQEIKIK